MSRPCSGTIPFKAEVAVRDMVSGVARPVLADASGTTGDHGDTVDADGGTYRRVKVMPGRAMTMSGPGDFLRPRYRPSGGVPSPVPAGNVLDLTVGGTAPARRTPRRTLGAA